MRPNARQRGYNTRWDTAAATFKARNPCCLGCAAMGQRVAVEVVDHVEPHKGDQRKFWDAALWQPACRWHHDAVKPKLERLYAQGRLTVSDLWLNSPAAVGMAMRTRRLRALDPDGWPIPWG